MPEPLTLTLTNPRSDRVKAVRALSGRSARRRSARLVVEGPQSVREAIRFAAVRIREVYVSQAAADRHGDIVGDAMARGLAVHLGTDEVLQALSADAQGLLAVVDDDAPHEHDALLDLLRQSLVGARLVAVLSQVRDPGNAGAVIRAADAAGADAVILTENSVDVGNPKVIRSTAGSLFHLPVITGLGLAGVTTELRAAGFQVFAADGGGEVELADLVQRPGDGGDTLDLTDPTAWVFGNEAWGLTPDDRALADAVIRVPLYGAAESLNLATAAAVCLYASAMAGRERTRVTWSLLRRPRA